MTVAPMIDAVEIARRIDAIRERVVLASRGRPVEIVAVTKGFGREAVDAAIEAGITAIGENYAQELLAKVTAGVGVAARWHFIGAVQRNKVAGLAPHVSMWQTVDRTAVAEAIARHAPGASALIQINLSGDPRRPGCEWSDAADLLGAARAAGLDVRGLMGVGPGGSPEASRGPFSALAALARDLDLPEVSMGMTDDLEVAIEEGSTMVRVGTAIFGPRPSVADLRR
jgi:pyridoxal phosphate enzyme (YggS family)